MDFLAQEISKSLTISKKDFILTISSHCCVDNAKASAKAIADYSEPGKITITRIVKYDSITATDVFTKTNWLDVFFDVAKEYDTWIDGVVNSSDDQISALGDNFEKDHLRPAKTLLAGYDVPVEMSTVFAVANNAFIDRILSRIAKDVKKGCGVLVINNDTAGISFYEITVADRRIGFLGELTRCDKVAKYWIELGEIDNIIIALKNKAFPYIKEESAAQDNLLFDLAERVSHFVDPARPIYIDVSTPASIDDWW